MRRVEFGPRSIPIAFAIVTVAAYGLLLPFTGFYWDDWPFAWTARFLGPAAFIPAFRGFRPFLGPIFFLTTSLIPPIPVLWQAFALVIRLLATLAAWFALDQVWPLHRRLTIPTALLFLVFPGYSQHWVALTHINQEWIPFVFYLLSFGFSFVAFRKTRGRLRYALLALVCLVIGLFPTEYFIGLEPLRFLFLWVIAAQANPGLTRPASRALKFWWPYALVWLADLAWLAYFYRSGVYVSYDLTAASAVPPVPQSLLIFADALWKAGFYSWFQILVLTARSITAPSTLISLLLTVAAFLTTALYLLRLQTGSPSAATADRMLSPHRSTALEPASASGFGGPAIGIGLLGILLGRIPSFAAGLPLTLQSSYDRFMISMMLGGTLLIAGLIALLSRGKRALTWAFAALIALGVGQQFFNANIFRRDWEGQQRIYWELAWRMPAIEPNTALITQQMPLDYETDLSMTAALNWIYAAQGDPPGLRYAMVYSEKRLGGPALPDLEPGTAMSLPFRLVSFAGNTSDTLTIYAPRNGCLRVLDPSLGDLQTYDGFPDSVTGSIPLSDPARIITGASARMPPSPPFAIEPGHTWCYFYEKAELARQTQNWQQVVELGADAAQRGLAPQDLMEWLPFIEGDARAGDVARAEATSRQIWNEAPKVHRGLCVLWNRLSENGPDAARSAASQLIGAFGCGH